MNLSSIEVFNSGKNFIKLLALCIQSLLVFHQTAIADEEIRGNKKITETKKVLDTFHKIDIDIFGSITVVCGAMPMVTITTDENIQPYIFTSVSGNTFKITSEGWIEPSKMNITIQLPFITDFTISNWGNVTILNIASEKLYVHAPTGNIKLTGKAKNLTIENGTGNVDAEELEAENVFVLKKGWGNVSVWANTSLEVKGNYGLVNYKGEPQLIGELGQETPNAQRIEMSKNEQIQYVKVTFKNNSSTRQNFIINGPQKGNFSYGFPMNAYATRIEDCPVGSKIYSETLGIKGKLLIEVKAEDNGKTLELFK